MTTPDDVILRDATVITMDGAGTIGRGLWTRGGRIAGVGDPEDLVARAGPRAAVVSLAGATVVPGFIDAHCHLGQLAYLLSAADCSQPSAPDIATIQMRLAETARDTRPGGWVTGNGYVEYLLGDRRHPTRWDLDRAVPDRPAVVYHASGHACVVNTAGLHAAGYTDTSPDPPGGLLGRDAAGRCNGVLLETMFRLFDANFERDLQGMGPAVRAELIGRASRQYAALGITACVDANGSAIGLAVRAFGDAEAAGCLAVRVSTMVHERGARHLIEAGITPPFGSDRFRVGALKVFADGGMSSRTAAVGAPYAVPPFDTGVLFHERPALAALVREFHEAGFQVAIHAQGDRAIRTTLQAYEDVMGSGSGNRLRHRIEHGGCLYPDLIDLAVRIGIHVASQPTFLSVLGDGFLEAFGEERGHLLYPFASMRRAGLVVGGSSDNPVVSAAPLLGIRDAVRRQTASGRVIGPGERLSAVEALALYTRGAAYVSGTDADNGSLEPGKVADYVVLAENPLAVDAARISDIRVLRTVVGGHAVRDAASDQRPLAS